MSEHAALILLGLAAKDVSNAANAGPRHRLGTCSWKASLKGRPVPCDLLRRAPGASARSVVYWGPDAGAEGTSLRTHQRYVAKRQPRGQDLMRATIDRFFKEVFRFDGDASACADARDGDPALPWSNYFLAPPEIWEELAKFDLVASAWLDAA